jgi:chromosome segregation ATPase
LKDARASYAALLESSTHVTNKLREEVQEVRSQLEKERANREEIESELSHLKQNSAPASDLSDKAAKVFSFIKPLLPGKTKLPSNTMSKLEEILGED